MPSAEAYGAVAGPAPFRSRFPRPVGHGIDVYTVPGSGTGCLPWPTGRGNLLRNGAGPALAP